MTAFTWLWAGWVLAFAAIELAALAVKDRPGQPATLSAQVWWLVRGAGLCHLLARGLLALGLGWLAGHLLG